MRDIDDEQLLALRGQFFASFVPRPEAWLCWMWTGRIDKDQYAKVRVGNVEVRASRLSWRIHNGPIPTGLLVMHLCDEPRCVRPSHLSLGTTESNQFDVSRKGRKVVGRRAA
jgi:hypothetical protein